MNRCMMMGMVRGMRSAFGSQRFEERQETTDQADGQRTADRRMHDALVDGVDRTPPSSRWRLPAHCANSKRRCHVTN
jgi:hypothetical protein